MRLRELLLDVLGSKSLVDPFNETRTSASSLPGLYPVMSFLR
jgi:hypothetical protein